MGVAITSTVERALASTAGFSAGSMPIMGIEGYSCRSSRIASFKLIDTIAAQPKICKHLHLPVQCGSDRLLAQMNRHYTVEHYLELIEYARKKVPGITFSSDIIVGFPGETEEDFQKTLELVQKVGYMQLFTFIYSKRTGTKAADMPDRKSVV